MFKNSTGLSLFPLFFGVFQWFFLKKILLCIKSRAVQSFFHFVVDEDANVVILSSGKYRDHFRRDVSELSKGSAIQEMDLKVNWSRNFILILMFTL